MLIRQLEQTYHAAVETAPAGEDAPVLLHNSGFAQPTQGVVETFALSRQGEIDPTGIIAWFYYAFLG
ncbi:MAG: hypothetical protein LUC50_03550 [Ruminococcus sp.]|nr:hypothetical protein [Ruminococcus sp.]